MRSTGSRVQAGGRFPYGEIVEHVLIMPSINVLGSFCVELEAEDGSKGFATGFGGPPACWLVAEHFERFLIGQVSQTQAGRVCDE